VTSAEYMNAPQQQVENHNFESRISAFNKYMTV